jgi:hypothetical protein
MNQPLDPLDTDTRTTAPNHRLSHIRSSRCLSQEHTARQRRGPELALCHVNGAAQDIQWQFTHWPHQAYSPCLQTCPKVHR